MIGIDQKETVKDKLEILKGICLNQSMCNPIKLDIKEIYVIICEGLEVKQPKNSRFV